MITLLQYRAEIDELAREIASEIKSSDLDLYDLIHEFVDSHQYIIYNCYHDDIINHSDNSEAYQDCYDAESIGNLYKNKGLETGFIEHKQLIAYFAMTQDIAEYISDNDLLEGSEDE